MLNQYANEANPDAHYKTTGPEIWRQTEGGVTHFVSGLGTCGTITGTGRYLKEQDAAVQVLGVHPQEGHDIPGVRIPNASFPGVVSTLPGPAQLADMLQREQQLANAGGQVSLPSPIGASPPEICGPNGSAADECLRTIPPREHGGNMDIRYLQAGVSIYLPCFIEGCGLTIGDLHYAQGDGEVSGTAIEMSANIWVTTELVTDGPDLSFGPHYEGMSRKCNY